MRLFIPPLPLQYMRVEKIVDAFRHECTLSGGTPDVRVMPRGVHATCDLGHYEVELEYTKGEDTYSLTVNVVSDTDEDIYDIFSALRTVTEA